MPIFVPCPDIVEVEFLSTLYDNVETENVVHLRNDAPPTTLAQMTALAIDLAMWHNLRMSPFRSEDATFDGVVVRPLDSAGLGGASDFADGGPGTVTGAALPNNNAARIELRTALGGRAHRGCLYFGGIPRGVVVGDTIDATYLDDLALNWSALQLEVNPSGFTWGVLSRFADGVPRTAGVFEPITDVFWVNQLVDSMRKRLR